MCEYNSNQKTVKTPHIQILLLKETTDRRSSLTNLAAVWDGNQKWVRFKKLNIASRGL